MYCTVVGTTANKLCGVVRILCPHYCNNHSIPESSHSECSHFAFVIFPNIPLPLPDLALNNETNFSTTTTSVVGVDYQGHGRSETSESESRVWEKLKVSNTGVT